MCPAPTGTEAGEEPWHPAEPRLPPCPVGFLLLHKHLREGRGAAARVCHHRLRHRQHSLHCRVGESSSSLPIASQQLGSSLWSVSGPRGLVTEQQSLLQARGITCSLSALSFHLQQLVKFITGIKQLTLIVREVQRLAQGHSQNAQLSGSRRQLSPLGILCSPQTLPQGRGDPSATPSLQCPVAFPALGGTRLEEGVCSEGHQALTHSLPTAICGGTSRPADPAPHRPGRHGRLCSAHDHRAGTAGELPCSEGGRGGGAGGERGGSRGHPKVLISAPGWPMASGPQMGLPSPSFCPTYSPGLGPDLRLPWAVSFHSYLVLNQLLPA